MKTLYIIKKGIFILALLSVMASCGKDGSVGPQGSEGTPGIPGKDGAVMLSGNGVPATTLGNSGDMYLDKTASNLYGPKTGSGWGIPLGLKGSDGTPGSPGTPGATGPSGTAGSRILSGLTNPEATSGVLGDYYLNRTSGDFFGPKTALGWGTAINLKGTANVVASTWVDYNWNNTNANTQKIMAHSIPTPIFNAIGYPNLQVFYNAGGVLLVYGRNYGSSHNVLFDYSFRNARYSLAVSHSAIPNYQFFISIESLNGANLLDTEYSSIRGNRFRYVLIPPGRQLDASAATLRNGQPDWSKKSYTEVKEILGIQD
ncbi:collagen-like domain-containing protein [Pedobacter frigoris]|uniref:Collagen-like protein n=1 Tax=Pedobacter frigoris TaxID=2571272 RepID=A0A4U1CM75_9SPHI|nr:collagen-like protein [Pedobacter frigoris]TKC07451.1 collagen-like protein [Pedobacter frigoris]